MLKKHGKLWIFSSSYITIKFDFSCMRTCECFSVSKFLGVFFRILFRWIWRIWSIKISQVILSNSYTSYFVKKNRGLCVLRLKSVHFINKRIRYRTKILSAGSYYAVPICSVIRTLCNCLKIAQAPCQWIF